MANKIEITAVQGREIFDCQGYPTLQADVWVNNTVPWHVPTNIIKIYFQSGSFQRLSFVPMPFSREYL